MNMKMFKKNYGGYIYIMPVLLGILFFTIVLFSFHLSGF